RGNRHRLAERRRRRPRELIEHRERFVVRRRRIQSFCAVEALIVCRDNACERGEQKNGAADLFDTHRSPQRECALGPCSVPNGIVTRSRAEYKIESRREERMFMRKALIVLASLVLESACEETCCRTLGVLNYAWLISKRISSASTPRSISGEKPKRRRTPS